MKCKIFINYDISEKNINDWLSKNPNINIESCTQVVKWGMSVSSPDLLVFYSDRKDKLNAINSLNDE